MMTLPEDGVDVETEKRFSRILLKRPRLRQSEKAGILVGGAAMDEKEPKTAHETRVRKAFESFHREVGERLDARARESLADVRDAATTKDGERLRRQLNDLSRHHSWLYRELASHPEVANLLDELALLGL